MAKKIRIGALISGGGTNLQAIIDAAIAGTRQSRGRPAELRPGSARRRRAAQQNTWDKLYS